MVAKLLRKLFVNVSYSCIYYLGTLNSPQLLMLSGIGPKSHLESLGIHVIEDLPVGYNLQDHVSMSALTFLVNESVTIVEPRLASNLANTVDYFVKGTGPLTLPGGAECLAFIDTKQDYPKNLVKKLQINTSNFHSKTRSKRYNDKRGNGKEIPRAIHVKWRLTI